MGSAAKVHQLEQQLKLRFEFVYSYHDINDVVPSSDDKAIVASGHQLHISIVPRDFSLKDKNTVAWRDVAAGRYDSELARQARGIATLPGKVYVTFDHEPDQPAKAGRGTPEDYVAAWHHVHDLYRRLGVQNVSWVWVMMGWEPSFDRAARLWPGNDYVDWISWEAYNHSGCLQGAADPTKMTSFADSVAATYNWLHKHGPNAGIDPKKPMMLSEAATVVYPGDAKRAASWYAAIPAVLQRFPQIKAITLFDNRTDECDYEFQQQPAVLAAVRAAIQSTRR